MRNLAKLFGIGEASPTIPADITESNSVVANEQNNAANTASITTEAVNVVDLQSVHRVSPDNIIPNPFQPRKTFNDDSLQELAGSIREFGVIQPLLVRRQGEAYELIAGERRLRASRLAGLTEVPVIVRELDDKEMAELAMIENLQREDLHFLEEAEGYQHLLASFSFTQEELARRVGKNQSTIANKLRLLKLAPEVRKVLVGRSLTERHARALLKIDDPRIQLEVLADVKEKGLNVRETEDLIENFSNNISQEKQPVPKQTVVKIIKDVRIFINTINSVISQMKKSGMDIKVKQEIEGDYVNISIQVKNSRK
ncbi:Chromosome-partitioning protein Spo0J [Sporomusa ovata DSM 2662]|uniref:Chromosome (Plasmid) partitioning protein ParB n=1 Tax=Sporomusa ovata TaxID=2378 RepID=A0A0U1KTN1_9FIRM|nr:nucleoid occlusion protein [Sporomusa ovata]EQB27681.1 parB-like partition protein [Sporomusa ovata DSM 2662]CQR70034.1 Chromosome (plasmid) partitioning protein ParB [Sporomusa ovata]